MKVNDPTWFIQESYIRDNLSRIFSDAIVTDMQFIIQEVSAEICLATGYSSDELKGKHLGLLSTCEQFIPMISTNLSKGFFEQAQFDLTTKKGEKHLFAISGFYLGLVSDINGLIVFKFHSQEETKQVYKKLEAQTAELDNFIYQSSHSLRGPLATLQGLIMLAKTSDNLSDLKSYIAKMETFAERLDERLHQLILFAEADKLQEWHLTDVPLYELIQNSIRQTQIEYPKFKGLIAYAGKDTEGQVSNGHFIEEILKNLLGFFVKTSSSSKRTNSAIIIDSMANQSALELSIQLKDVVVQENIKNQLIEGNLGYKEILTEPDLINCFLARKAVMRLRGNLHFTVNNKELFAYLIIPYNKPVLH